MPKETVTSADQRNYPAYQLGRTEIALAEYEAASQRSQADEQALSIANGVLVLATIPLVPTFSPFIRSWVSNGRPFWDSTINLILFLGALTFTAFVASSYVCQLRRSFVYSGRKVIVLRRMMGQSYGPATLVLPNWRLEGADNAFALHLFPGWHPRGAYPFYALAAIFVAPCVYGIYVFLVTHGIDQFLTVDIADRQAKVIASGLLGICFGVTLLAYIRRELFDYDETVLLRTTIIAAKMLGVRINEAIETTMYEARLARIEAMRVGIEFEILREFAVAREDRRYFRHSGVDPIAMLRALFHRARGVRAGGGTTITQQLARTLFIKDMNKTVRRKILEIPLGLWLDGRATKKELLEIYLSSVRFDAHVMGVAAAMRHFFGSRTKKVTRERAFVLIERISNISSEFKADTIGLMLAKFVAEGLIDRQEAGNILRLYDRLVTQGKLKPGTGRKPLEVLSDLQATDYR